MSQHHALETHVPRIGVMTRVRELPTAVVLCVLVVVSTAVRIAIGRTVPAPTVFSDELVYSELARSFAASGDFAVRGEHVSVWTYGPLYPILISPAYLLSHSATAAFEIVKAINAVLFSLAAVPAYFLARRVVSRRAAYAAAGLALLVPSAVYSTKVMAENASYPVFLLALLAIFAALDRSTRRNQLLALGTVCLATSARAQMVILLPAYLSAICLASWIDRRERPTRPTAPQRLAAFRVTWLAALAAAAALVVAIASGAGIFGTYGEVLHHRLRPELAPERLLWLIADLDLYSGVIPFASFLLCAAWALGRGDRPPRLRLFAVLTASASLWLSGLAAVYTTAFAHVYDRYAFYLVPLFVIALLAWIEQGLPKPRNGAMLLGVGAAALLPLALPLGTLLRGQEWGTSTSSVGLVPWAFVSIFAGHGLLLKLMMLALSIGLAASVVRARLEHAWSLARSSVALFVLAGFIVSVGNAVLARSARNAAGPERLDWIDTAVGPRSDVALIWRGSEEHAQPSDHRFGLREAVFFNSAVGTIYDLEDPLFPGTPSTHVSRREDLVVRDDGRVARADYVLAATNLRVAGVRVAGDAASGLSLYRVSGPIRVGS